jgi:N4-(beta-N-acetylglucosaminyl)-L-asparaginase
MKRRRFLATTALVSLPASSILGDLARASAPGLAGSDPAGGPPSSPVVVSTWNFAGANEAAFESLKLGGTPLDAVESGIRVVESDPTNTSVGIGGYPDRDGHLTLDASIMEGAGRCGSVVFTEGVANPITLARLVMEKTPHVMLAGEGAEQFAREQGLPLRKDLTPGARKAWEEWLNSSGHSPPPVGKDNHDTIGLLALKDGRMAGGCSTSGAAWKMRGRVGDSPIVGAGLFVDDAVGAATSTGLGETVIRVAGSALIVELMRQGRTPTDACREAVERILSKQPQYRGQMKFLVAFLALRKDGEVGAYGAGPGFEYAVVRDGKKTVVTADYTEV